MLIFRILSRFSAAVLAAALLALPVRAAAPGGSAEAMILLHGPSGLVLAARSADARLPMASTTKLMTALVVLEHCDCDAPVTIESDWTRVEGSSMYLRAGETYTVRELLCGLLLCSGNDAATALACFSAGGVEEFAVWMNGKAAELGLANTHFTNPHGLSDAEHYSSARDLALIMAAGLQNPVFREIVGTRTFTSHGLTYRNHNKLLWLCEGATGGKTGYTKAAGRCLVSSCLRDGLELICVTLSDPDDWDDHCALYRWGYEHYRGWSLSAGDVLARVPVISGAAEEAEAAAGQGIELCLPRAAELLLTADLPRFLYAPVTGGAPAGRLCVRSGDCLLAETPLTWAADVPAA